MSGFLFEGSKPSICELAKINYTYSTIEKKHCYMVAIIEKVDSKTLSEMLGLPCKNQIQS